MRTPPESFRLLVVDDDAALLDALSEALRLRFEDVTVDTCESASDALQRIACFDYDSIISDIKMPGVDGIELLAEVQKLAPDVPVLLITGHGETDLAIRAIRAGAFDLIQKPLDRDYFIAALRRAAEVHRLRRELAEKQASLEQHARELEERVDERTQELQLALQAKNEFLGLVSHELRNPVTVVMGNADLLFRRNDSLNREERTNVLADLRQETRRLSRIIENLLLLSRVEHGLITEVEPVLLSRLVKGQVGAHELAFPSRRMMLCLEDPLPLVYCDATHVELVLSNLLSNAEKYSPSTEPIEVEARAAEEEVLVSVLDKGYGIRPEEIELVFRPFYRSAATSHFQGMGIGLAVCRRLLEVQGGRIWAEPRAGGGSKFCFALPVVRIEEPSEAMSSAQGT